MNRLVQRIALRSTRGLIWLAPVLALAFGGCATTERGVSQKVEINSYPYQARVYIDGEPAGTTPLTAILRSKTTYEVKFEKAGYKPYVEYIGPSLDLKHDPILKIGPLQEAGFYNRLGPNPLEIELEHVLVPDIAGTDILREMLVKTEQIDGLLRDGKIGAEEHRYVAQQIIDFYKDESARRGAPLLSMAPPPAAAAGAELPPPAFPPAAPASPATPMAIPGELNSLDNLDLDSLDSLDLPAPGSAPAPAPTPTPASTGIPDLTGLDNLTLPDAGSVTVPPMEPVAPTPPPLAPPPTGVQPAPLPTPVPGAPVPPTPTAPGTPATPAPATPATPTTPAPFDPLNFGN